MPISKLSYLKEIETSYLKSFNLDTLYNFTPHATSLKGYTHTEEAKAKMRARFINFFTL